MIRSEYSSSQPGGAMCVRRQARLSNWARRPTDSDCLALCHALRGHREAAAKARSLLLDDDAPLSVREDAIATTVLTRRQVVILALLACTDDLPARQALQGNHRRQILQDCRALLSRHGARDERRHDTDQGPPFRTRGHSDAPPSS